MINFFDLAAQQTVIKKQIDKNIAKVLHHGKYILGPEVALLENKLCKYTGSKYCITCGNGTDALQISLMAIGVGPGDEVIVPGFSYIATAEAIALLGAKPVYVDVEKATCNIDVKLIEEKITTKTKAIIPVSLYGQPADFKEINTIAKKYDITVIEDAAQSFGSEYYGKKSCNLSTIGCTSFFPTKPLGCYGDGGAIFTSDKDLANKIRQISRHGQEKRYHHVRLGVNSRLDTLQAAVLLAKINILDHEIEARNSLSNKFSNIFRNFKTLKTPKIASDKKSAWAQYTLQCANRSKIQEELTASAIPFAVYYPLPMNMQPAILNRSHLTKVSLELSQCVLSLPFHAYMSEVDFDIICNAMMRSEN